MHHTRKTHNSHNETQRRLKKSQLTVLFLVLLQPHIIHTLNTYTMIHFVGFIHIGWMSIPQCMLCTKMPSIKVIDFLILLKKPNLLKLTDSQLKNQNQTVKTLYTNFINAQSTNGGEEEGLMNSLTLLKDHVALILTLSGNTRASFTRYAKKGIIER